MPASDTIDKITEKLTPQRIFLIALMVTLVTTVGHVFFNNYPGDDVAKFYAPMARAFAEGNYERAFFPTIPPLMPVLGGLVAKIVSLDAFNCLIIVSGVFFSFTLFPLRRFLLNYLTPTHAAWGCLAFASAPRIIKYAGGGLLTSGRLFFMTWAIVLIIDYAKQRKVSQLVWLGINLAGLSLIRGEGILFIPFMFIWAVILLHRTPNTEHRTPITFLEVLKATAVVGTVLVACISPRLYQTYQKSGTPALDERQAKFIGKIVGSSTPAQRQIINKKAEKTNDVVFIKTEPGGPLAFDNVLESIERFFNGSYKIYFALAVIGLFFVVRRKQWQIEHTLAVTLVVFNAVVFIPIAIASRYYTINLILFLPFTIVGANEIYALCRNKKKELIFCLIVAVGLVVQVRKGSDRILKSKYRNNEYKIVGEWLNQNRESFRKEVPTILASERNSKNQYQPGSDLIIASRKVQTAYWAKADHISLNDIEFTVVGFDNYMTSNKVDVIVAEGQASDLCRTLNLIKEDIPSTIPQEIYCLNKKAK